MEFTDFPDAPVSGADICAVSDIPEGGFYSGFIGAFPVIAVRLGDGFRVYVNACPHLFLPLDQRGSVRGADGVSLLCSNHNAVFDLETGEGTGGFGLGCRLTPVPFVEVGARLVVARG